MGIIARIRYLLETDPSTALEECLISILIAIARHSPACTDAIMKCQRLVQTVVNRFTMKDQMEINPAKIKAVTLLKVLAQSKKKNCMQFIKNGTFQKMTWHLYRSISLDLWVKSGRENCKFSSDLLVEQLRLWKVCIQYGYCVSSFADLLPALCIWLDVPTFENLIVNNILDEFAAITKEAYLVLEALTRQLPNFYSQVDLEESATEDKETWCWSHVGPIVELALKWIALKSDPYLSRFFDWKNGNMNNSVLKDQQVKSLLWVISAVMHMISGLLARVIPEDTFSLPGGHVPWLPEFVPKIGLEIIKQGIFCFTGVSDKEYGKDPARGGSFLEHLCHLRHQSEYETAITSVVCLNGLVQVVVYVDKLIRLANIHTTPSQCFSSSSEDNILANGIIKSCMVEMEIVLTTFMNLITSEGQCMQSIEMFGRGGPAPGVGAGWGASGGGFWSTAVLLAQMDANFLIHLLEIFPILCAKDPGNSEEMRFIMQRINCALHICLVVGPKDRVMMDKLLGYLLQVPVLKCLDLCIHKFLNLNKGFKLFEWRYKEEDYLLFSNNLASHFKNRWLCEKNKSKVESTNRDVDHKTSIKSKFTLDTIHEDCDASNIANQEHHLTSLVVEWAHQRLPLPSHWFLSSLSTINDSKTAELPSASDSLNCKQNATDLLEVAKGGLFFLLGIEAISAFLSSEFHSSVQGVPLSWKLHSLSVSLFVGMGVLEEKSRDLYENLQEVYGQLLENSRFPQIGDMNSLEFLKFQSDIHESYSTFIEALVEQFAAVSYGDLVYGRQVSIYLHRCVEAPVRLAAWNSLSNARALELLPPIEKCVAKVEGYLEPAEDNEKILEAYVKSWTTGALDKAVRRGSIAFTLVLHHLSTFIFGNFTGENISVRNKLAKSILRDYSRKQQHEGMVMDLIRYNKLSTCQKLGEEVLKLQLCEIDKRFNVLKEACEGSYSLLRDVEKLESYFRK